MNWLRVKDERRKKENNKTNKVNVDKLPCPLCGRLYKNNRGLSIHMTSLHSCDYCNGTFKDLEGHIKIVHETEQCLECGIKFTSTTGLQRHLSKTHLVECNVCKKQFFNLDVLAVHMKTDHEDECEMCGEIFLKPALLLEAHMDTEHGIKPRIVKQFSGGMFMMVSN